jgi:hypothetical protein
MRRSSRPLVPALVAGAIAFASLPPLAYAQTTPAPAQTPPAAAAPAADGTLDVVVTYSGKGTVSKKNEISIFLFTDPNINEASMPVAVGTIEQNGGTFAFAGLAPVVYHADVYDDTANY